MKKAVILLSGGLDSTTCLAVAQSQGFDCYGLIFDYGQRHAFEVQNAIRVAKKMGANYRVFKLDIQQFGGSALTDQTIEVPDYTGSSEIPVTYVPARNTIFLSIALAYAETLLANDIFIGVSSIDYSHYPDCRPEFIQAFQHLANVATKMGVEDQGFKIHTPLITLSKAETVQLGISLNVDYGLTVSCYKATDDGKACGECDSCALRKKGFLEANLADPTVYI